MAHGLNPVLKRGANSLACKNDGKAGIGSRRIFAPQFKLQVLDSYRNDADCKGNQRATARKYGIHRRQIQKWLQVENNLRNSVIKSKSSELIVSPEARKYGIELALRGSEHRQRDDVSSEPYSRQRQVETEAELEQGTVQRIGGLEARDVTTDKRVPDIPQHSPAYPEHQWRCNNRSVGDREVEYKSQHRQGACTPSSSPPPLLASCRPHPLDVESATPAAAAPTFKCEFPEASPLPLDFTTHSRQAGSGSPRGASPPLSPQAIASDNAAPMDLSLKKPYMPYPRIETDLHAPVLVCSDVPPAPQHRPVIHLDHPPPDSQIWDLSTKGTKRSYEDDVTGYSYCSNVSSSTCDTKPAVQETTNKPVKLFKPYLLDQEDNDSSNSSNDMKPSNFPTSSSEACHLHPAFTNTTSSTLYSDSDSYFYNNNNNNNSEFKIEYPYYKDETYHLEFRSNGNYYCPVSTDYYTGNNIHLGSPNEETKESLIYSKNVTSVKQRQSYSLDFKLSAIQCYYSDAVCRGNQRAVATKYKIHRRQVQKWLKQEDQLRQRNETGKHMHIIR